MRTRNGPARCYLPEKRVHQRGREFAENGLAENFEQKEGLQIREYGWRQQGHAANSPGKLVSILNSNGAAAIVTDDMPALDPIAHSQLLDLSSDLLEVRGAICQKRSSAHSGQIDDKAPEMTREIAYHAIPETPV